MSQKKNNRRKGAAVALAVLGVAGLTLASAAQINLTNTGTVQAGVTTLADCQTSDVVVSFEAPTLDGADYVSSSLTLNGIDAACDTKNFRVALLGDEDSLLGSEQTGDVDGTQITVNLDSVDQHAIEKVALTIYG